MSPGLDRDCTCRARWYRYRYQVPLSAHYSVGRAWRWGACDAGAVVAEKHPVGSVGRDCFIGQLRPTVMLAAQHRAPSDLSLSARFCVSWCAAVAASAWICVPAVRKIASVCRGFQESGQLPASNRPDPQPAGGEVGEARLRPSPAGGWFATRNLGALLPGRRVAIVGK